MKTIYILGGGTFNHVRNHLSIAAPAFGGTARQLKEKFDASLLEQNLQEKYKTQIVLTDRKSVV